MDAFYACETNKKAELLISPPLSHPTHLSFQPLIDGRHEPKSTKSSNHDASHDLHNFRHLRVPQSDSFRARAQKRAVLRATTFSFRMFTSLFRPIGFAHHHVLFGGKRKKADDIIRCEVWNVRKTLRLWNFYRNFVQQWISFGGRVGLDMYVRNVPVGGVFSPFQC
ncbi:hypothetical protein AVEN_175064-1 [Araneus ventricosus]|uniref:Uncharacterized protein n=1 Tax=Araneus ventricosus TaxID=182803 RepID=A0A4Y2NGD7_ARAVE|nr:hypothetical protein AVEN_175064-1 [Araneus ventricosus]